MMSVAERKDREKKEMMDLILLKAKEIILKEGQEKLSIRKIAQEIDYSPSTIYLYFQDKDEILYQMMQKGFEMMALYMEPYLHESNPVKRIYNIGIQYIKFGKENSDWYDLMFAAPSPMKHIQRSEQEWGHGIAIFEFLVASCKEAISQQKIKNWEERVLALHLWSSIHGLVGLINTQRLCVVDHIYDTNEKNDLVMQTLDGIMLNTFKFKI
jgi:AcrR family transcriptional regulator